MSTPSSHPYAKGFDTPHADDIILESHDNVRFYFRLPLLCVCSSVFKDMMDSGTGTLQTTDQRTKYADKTPLDTGTTTKDNSGHAIVPLPNATAAGLDFALRCINHAIQASELEAPERHETFAEALQIANTHAIPVVRVVLVPLAERRLCRAINGYSFQMLAIYLLAGVYPERVNPQARLTFEDDMDIVAVPTWVKDVMRSVDPRYVERLYEIHLKRLTAAKRLQASLSDREIDGLPSNCYSSCQRVCLERSISAVYDALLVRLEQSKAFSIESLQDHINQLEYQFSVPEMDRVCRTCFQYVKQKVQKQVDQYRDDLEPSFILSG